jgi:RHS repeat-associated protein
MTGRCRKRTNSALCFGDCRNSQGTLGTDKEFTGQRLDGTGLYYYNARYYDPTIGRFISADTVVQNVNNPQCFNRYSYVLNNPLNSIDPTGNVRIDAEDDPGATSQEVKEFWKKTGELCVENPERTDVVVNNPPASWGASRTTKHF